MTKKILIIAASAFLIVFGLAQTTFAHEVLEDHDVAAVLHIDPGDNPIVGKVANLHFDFRESKTPIDLTNCTCTVTVTQGTTTLFKKVVGDPMLDVSHTGIAFQFTFPQKGDYVVGISGTVASTMFSLADNLTVDREYTKTNLGDVIDFFDHNIIHHSFHIIVFGGALIIGGIIVWCDKKKSTKETE